MISAMDVRAFNKFQVTAATYVTNFYHTFFKFQSVSNDLARSHFVLDDLVKFF